VGGPQVEIESTATEGLRKNIFPVKFQLYLVKKINFIYIYIYFYISLWMFKYVLVVYECTRSMELGKIYGVQV